MEPLSPLTPRSFSLRHRGRAGLVLMAIAMTLLMPGAAASPLRVHTSMAQGSIPVMQPPVEEPNWNVTSGVRHFVFDCADGYPGDEAGLEDFFADCELLYVYTCLDQTPWSPVPVKPGCEDPRRL